MFIPHIFPVVIFTKTKMPLVSNSAFQKFVSNDPPRLVGDRSAPTKEPTPPPSPEVDDSPQKLTRYPSAKTWTRYFHQDTTRSEKVVVEAINSADIQPPSAGSRLATGGNDTTVRVWRLDWPPKLIGECGNLHTKCVHTVRWSPAGDVLASGSMDGNLILWHQRPKEEAVRCFGEQDLEEYVEAYSFLFSC